MVYEIEKRSLFESSNDFKQCESEVAKIGKATNKYIFKSFLFKSPEYLRIRIVLEKDTAEITKKIGTYEDAAREEINEHISLQKLPNFIKGLIKEGYDKCTCVKTESNNYEIGELTISFNTIESLGMIIEIEALTNEKSQIPILEKKIIDIMDTLGLKELSSKTYQEMIDKMHADLTKPTSQQEFTLQ